MDGRWRADHQRRSAPEPAPGGEWILRNVATAYFVVPAERTELDAGEGSKVSRRTVSLVGWVSSVA